jgi:hypothetical protein
MVKPEEIPEPGEKKKDRKITETVQVTTEYSEARIDEAIGNLTGQIDSLTAERLVWEKRKELVEKQ